jgi:hypothetical protein
MKNRRTICGSRMRSRGPRLSPGSRRMRCLRIKEQQQMGRQRADPIARNWTFTFQNWTAPRRPVVD